MFQQQIQSQNQGGQAMNYPNNRYQITQLSQSMNVEIIDTTDNRILKNRSNTVDEDIMQEMLDTDRGVGVPLNE